MRAELASIDAELASDCARYKQLERHHYIYSIEQENSSVNSLSLSHALSSPPGLSIAVIEPPALRGLRQ